MSFEHTEEIPQQVKPTIPESLVDRGAQTLLCGDIRARVNDIAVWGGGGVEHLRRPGCLGSTPAPPRTAG